MTADDLAKLATRARRETTRWLLLLTLNIARPAEAHSGMLRSVVAAVFSDITDLEVRRELEYLQFRDLVTTRSDPLGQLHSKLTRDGVDVVEYTVDCQPGIARPPAGA